MKKVLILATALTLLSCEKETIVSNENKACDCYTIKQQRQYSSIDSKDEYEEGYYWHQTERTATQKDFCINSYDWRYETWYLRDKRVCN